MFYVKVYRDCSVKYLVPTLFLVPSIGQDKFYHFSVFFFFFFLFFFLGGGGGNGTLFGTIHAERSVTVLANVSVYLFRLQPQRARLESQ